MRANYQIFMVIVVFLLAPSLHAYTVYKWVDEKDIVNYTDDYDKVPLIYRDRVELKNDFFEEGSSTSSFQEMILKKKEAIKPDIYSGDETYWRERVGPWRDRLKEAEANYQEAHKKFMDKAMEFSRRRFGSWSPTQYKSNIVELDRMKEEMIKYGDQIAEANEALDRRK